MGTQQILFIVLGLIVVGVAIIVAFSMVKHESTQSARDSLQNDLSLLILESQEFYHKTGLFGGGGNSFSGMKPDDIRLLRSSQVQSATEVWVTANGTYMLLSVAPDSVVLEGVGVNVGTDGVNPVKVRAIVRASSFALVTVN